MLPLGAHVKALGALALSACLGLFAPAGCGSSSNGAGKNPGCRRVAGCSAFRGSSGGGPPIAVTYRPVCYKRPTRLVKTEAAAAELMAALAAEAAEEGG